MKEEKTSLYVVLPSLSVLHHFGTAGEPTNQKLLGAIIMRLQFHVAGVTGITLPSFLRKSYPLVHLFFKR